MTFIHFDVTQSACTARLLTCKGLASFRLNCTISADDAAMGQPSWSTRGSDASGRVGPGSVGPIWADGTPAVVAPAAGAFVAVASDAEAHAVDATAADDASAAVASHAVADAAAAACAVGALAHAAAGASDALAYAAASDAMTDAAEARHVDVLHGKLGGGCRSEVR